MNNIDYYSQLILMKCPEDYISYNCIYLVQKQANLDFRVCDSVELCPPPQKC